MKYTKNRTLCIDPDTEPGQSLLYLGTPSASTCPYDHYARMIATDARKCFARAGIPATVHLCHRSIVHPIGSGPDGAVRFGDDMLPPDVQAVVASEDVARAADAWETWQARRYFRRPFSVSGNLVWKGDAWQRGGTWPFVIGNAVALAAALGRSPERRARLAAYAARHGVNVKLA